MTHMSHSLHPYKVWLPQKKKKNGRKKEGIQLISMELHTPYCDSPSFTPKLALQSGCYRWVQRCPGQSHMTSKAHSLSLQRTLSAGASLCGYTYRPLLKDYLYMVIFSVN